MIRRFQFSFRFILALTTVIALIIGEKTAFSRLVAGYVGFFGTFIAISLAAVAAVEGKRSTRAFAIGALLPLSIMTVVLAKDDFMEKLRAIGDADLPGVWASIGAFYRTCFVNGWLMSIVLGTICVVFRWLIDRPDK